MPEPKMPSPYPPATVPNIRSEEHAEPAMTQGKLKPFWPMPGMGAAEAEADKNDPPVTP